MANQCCYLQLIEIEADAEDLASAYNDALDAELKIHCGQALDFIEVKKIKHNFSC